MRTSVHPFSIWYCWKALRRPGVFLRFFELGDIPEIPDRRDRYALKTSTPPMRAESHWWVGGKSLDGAHFDEVSTTSMAQISIASPFQFYLICFFRSPPPPPKTLLFPCLRTSASHYVFTLLLPQARKRLSRHPHPRRLIRRRLHRSPLAPTYTPNTSELRQLPCNPHRRVEGDCVQAGLCQGDDFG